MTNFSGLVPLNGHQSYAAWSHCLKNELDKNGLLKYILEENPQNTITGCSAMALDFILSTVGPVLYQLNTAGYDKDDPTYQNPFNLYRLIEVAMTNLRAADGRSATRLYLTVQRDDYGSIREYIERLDGLHGRMQASGGELSDTARIWHCLNCLDDADDAWVTKLAKPKGNWTKRASGDQLPDATDWNQFTTWSDFSKELVRCSEQGLKFATRENDIVPVHNQSHAPSPPQAASNAFPKKRKNKKKKKGKGFSNVSEDASRDGPIEATTNAGNGRVLEEDADLVDHIATEYTVIEPELKSDIGHSLTRPSDHHFENNTGNYNGGNETIGHEAKSTKATENTVEQNTGANRPTGGSGIATSKAKRNKAKQNSHQTNPRQSQTREFEYIDYQNGYDDDEGLDDDDDENVVYIGDERRFRIQGYNTQKRSRKALIDAPRSAIKNFFFSRFPGRPSCIDCKCKHPVEAFAFCRYCLFCHIGGEAECYHLHPELRGTRPMKDKYRKLTIAELHDSDFESDIALAWYHWLQDELGDSDDGLTEFGYDGAAAITAEEVRAHRQAARHLSKTERDDVYSWLASEIKADGEDKRAAQFLKRAMEGREREEEATEDRVHTEEAGSVEELAPAAAVSVPAPDVSPSVVQASGGAALDSLPLRLKNAPVTEPLQASISISNGAKITPLDSPGPKRHRRNWGSMESFTTSSSEASLGVFRRQLIDTKLKEANRKKKAADQVAMEDAERAAAEKARMKKKNKRQKEKERKKRREEERRLLSDGIVIGS